MVRIIQKNIMNTPDKLRRALLTGALALSAAGCDSSPVNIAAPTQTETQSTPTPIKTEPTKYATPWATVAPPESSFNFCPSDMPLGNLKPGEALNASGTDGKGHNTTEFVEISQDNFEQVQNLRITPDQLKFVSDDPTVINIVIIPIGYDDSDYRNQKMGELVYNLYRTNQSLNLQPAYVDANFPIGILASKTGFTQITNVPTIYAAMDKIQSVLKQPYLPLFVVNNDTYLGATFGGESFDNRLASIITGNSQTPLGLALHEMVGHAAGGLSDGYHAYDPTGEMILKNTEIFTSNIGVKPDYIKEAITDDTLFYTTGDRCGESLTKKVLGPSPWSPMSDYLINDRAILELVDQGISIWNDVQIRLINRNIEILLRTLPGHAFLQREPTHTEANIITHLSNTRPDSMNYRTTPRIIAQRHAQIVNLGRRDKASTDKQLAKLRHELSQY